VASARLNVVVSGGTGAGKTTLLNALAGCIPPGERVVTVEDAAELRLPLEHVVRLEARPANAEGAGEVRVRDLVRNALRMRPDRIVVGEVRGAEALDMLQAMNTGHEGSLSTCHANGPADALRRLETMVLAGGGSALPLSAVREQVASAVDLVVQIARVPDGDGARAVVGVDEVVPLDAGEAGVRPLAVRRLASSAGVAALPSRPLRSPVSVPADRAWVER
jgi:pilus assembly protein CpaF